ncbi:MAG: Uma2 family endonuclease [Chloroflexi bacterium]|nr:Uma2 family endonuclease [Chloroflexota bacterium]
MVVQLTRRRFTVSEYEQMAQAGILDEDDRVELIDGEVIEMTPIGPRHAGCVNRLSDLMFSKFRSLATVSPQNPVIIGEYTALQPDLALLRHRPDFYASSHPKPSDVLLLVEVADSSVARDRHVKMPLYAQSGIPEVWLVDMEQESITVYREPVNGGYRTAQVLRRGDKLAPAAFPSRKLSVADILG